MKKYIAILLAAALSFGIMDITSFAEQVNDEITLLAPPSGKLTVYPVQLKNDDGQPEENVEFSASNLPKGVALNKNGKLVLNGDEVTDGDFSINASNENTTATIEARVLPVRYYEDFEDVEAGENVNSTRLNNLDGSVSQSSITTETDTVLVATDGNKKYADTSSAGARLSIDTSAFASGCTNLTIEAMVKRGSQSPGIKIKPKDKGYAELKFFSTDWMYWQYNGSSSTNVNMGYKMSVDSEVWEKVILKIDLINGTIDTSLGNVWRSRVTIEAWKDSEISLIEFGFLLDEVDVYTGLETVTSIEKNIPQTITVSKTKKTEVPFYSSVEPFGYIPELTSNVSGITSQHNILYIAPNTQTGEATLSLSGLDGTDFYVSEDFNLNIEEALEEDFQSQVVGENIVQDGENLYHTGTGSFNSFAVDSVVFEAKVKDSGKIIILNDGENIELSIAGNDVSWHDVTVLLNDDKDEYVYIYDNELLREGEYSGSTVTGISVEGISIDDIYMGNTYESLPRALDVGYLGNALDGNTLTATYKYFSATDKPKESFDIEWYLSDTTESLGECISTDEELQLIKEYIGKYLTLAVTVTGGGVKGETAYSTPVIIKDLFTPSIADSGIELEINNVAENSTYYVFAVLYTTDSLSDIYAVKLTEDVGTVTRILPIKTSYDGAYIFMTDENFVPAGVMKSVGSVPAVGIYSSESNFFCEKDGNIIFSKTPVEQATLLVLKPRKLNSFKEAGILANVADVIPSAGGSIADYVAFATVADSDKSFAHNIKDMGYYHSYAIFKSGEKNDFYFSIKLHELFASNELKNATEEDFIDILNNYTDLDEETLKKLYTVYKVINNKEKVGKFLEAENMDMSFLKTAIYLTAFLENDDYEKELVAVLNEKNFDSEGITLMAQNSDFKATVAALPAPCKITDYIVTLREKAILLGIKNAANYMEVKKYLAAVSDKQIYDSMAEDFLGREFESIAKLSEEIDDYIPNKGGLGGGTGGGSGGGSGGFPSVGINATLPVANKKDDNVNKSRFTDMNENHWAYEYVLKLADKKVIEGYNDGSFLPEKNVTRAELVKIICVAFNLSGQGESFSDVKTSDWFYHYVSSAAYCGVIKGDGGNFRPGDFVSREDAALMLWRVAKEHGTKFADEKTDISDLSDVAGYAREAVKALNGAGIINGMETGKYMPKEYLTRAQAATILVRLLAVE